MFQDSAEAERDRRWRSHFCGDQRAFIFLLTDSLAPEYYEHSSWVLGKHLHFMLASVSLRKIHPTVVLKWNIWFGEEADEDCSTVIMTDSEKDQYIFG